MGTLLVFGLGIFVGLKMVLQHLVGEIRLQGNGNHQAPDLFEWYFSFLPHAARGLQRSALDTTKMVEDAGWTPASLELFVKLKA
jgi:hypothetical protein